MLASGVNGRTLVSSSRIRVSSRPRPGGGRWTSKRAISSWISATEARTRSSLPRSASSSARRIEARI